MRLCWTQQQRAWLLLLFCVLHAIGGAAVVDEESSRRDIEEDNNFHQEYDTTTTDNNNDLWQALDSLLQTAETLEQQQEGGGGLLWKDLSVTTAAGTTLLHPTCGFVPKGAVCALLGPSGSGKSTLLAALGGRSRHCVDGTVVVVGDAAARVGQPPQPSQVAWLSQSSNHFFSLLTPRETLELAAFLEWPESRTTAERRALVQQQLDSLGLQRVADQAIGDSDLTSAVATTPKLLLPRRLSSLFGNNNNNNNAQLSGGERRRLSVALELVSAQLPVCLLADEPTSGLDATLAVTVLHWMRQQAAQQLHIPVLTSLHQPKSSVWPQPTTTTGGRSSGGGGGAIDYVLLLAPGGHVCYCGPAGPPCLEYFAALGYPCPAFTNPAEFLVDLVSIRTAAAAALDEDDGAVEDPAEEDRARIAFLAHAFATHQAKHWKDPSFFVESNYGDGAKDGRSLFSFESFSQLHPCRRRRRNVLRHARTAVRRWAALWRRSWRQTVRHAGLHAFRLAASVGNAVLLAKIFPSVGLPGQAPRAASVADRVALLSFGAINMAFLAFLKSVTLFAQERPVVHREQTRRQYSSLEYLLAKVLAEWPWDALFAGVFTTTLKLQSGLAIGTAPLTATFVLLTAATASLGLVLGSWIPNASLATTASVPLLVILMVVGIINPSGVDPHQKPPPRVVRALKAWSPFRFGIEALCLGEYPGMEFDSGHNHKRWWQRVRDLPRMGAFALVQNGDQVLHALGLQHQTYRGAMIQLAVLTGQFLSLSWLGLQVQQWLLQRRRPKRKKPVPTPKEAAAAGETASPQPLIKVPMVR